MAGGYRVSFKFAKTQNAPNTTADMNANLPSLFWEGFELDSFSFIDTQSLLIRLRLNAHHSPFCGSCNQHTLDVHDVTNRRVRERDLFHYRVWFDVPVRRVGCLHCGPKVESINWLPRPKVLTLNMISWVESLVRLLPIQHVSNLIGLHWHTVKSIDHQRLRRELPEPDRSQLRRLMMDEFALFTGHRYAKTLSMPILKVFFGWANDTAEKPFDRSSNDWVLMLALELKPLPWT